MKARISGQPQGSRNDMMQRIQKMQEDMQAAQAEVESTEFTGSAGGDGVVVTLNGKHELLSVKLKPEVIDPEDDALAKANDAMESRMNAVTGGMNIPGLGF